MEVYVHGSVTMEIFTNQLIVHIATKWFLKLLDKHMTLGAWEASKM